MLDKTRKFAQKVLFPGLSFPKIVSNDILGSIEKK